ncbi:hypothetical protein J6590_028366 [Homalodisca vitripennis]|nr:hypothetical protein J6590_028366 [Homalodisca vitripennis]
MDELQSYTNECIASLVIDQLITTTPHKHSLAESRQGDHYSPRLHLYSKQCTTPFHKESLEFLRLIVQLMFSVKFFILNVNNSLTESLNSAGNRLSASGFRDNITAAARHVQRQPDSRMRTSDHFCQHCESNIPNSPDYSRQELAGGQLITDVFIYAFNPWMHLPIATALHTALLLQRKTLDAITTPAKEVVSPCTTACASPPRPSVSPAPTLSASTPTPLTSDAHTSEQPTTTEDLEAENAQLKKRIEDLSFQLECVIDHTIKNDARLLQYTSEIFSTNTSESVKPVIGNTETSQETPATLKDCSVHCDPVSTNYERSAEDRELIDSLKTTIQVLEAELECLRSECKLCMCKNSGPWSTYVKKRSLPIDLQNKFLPLDSDNNERKTNKLEKRQSTQNKNKKKKKKKVNTGTGHWQTKKKKDNAPLNVEPKSIEQVPSEITFSSMLIVGDSHGRHLAGMVQDLIGGGPKVTGVCKPGAGLLDVASSGPSSDDFTVLIAGTNDIANGQRSNIFRHLERVLQDRMGASRVVVSTVPHRHDLPAWHPVHRDTDNVNRHIEEIAARHAGVKVLDFNKIPRRMFTRHGMHLRMPGKRLLARHLLQCLHQFADDGVASPPTPGAAITHSMAAADGSCGSPARVPVMLQHDSYSEAVKAQLSASAAPATPPTPPPQPLPSTTALPASPPAPATPPTPPPQPLPSQRPCQRLHRHLRRRLLHLRSHFLPQRPCQRLHRHQ